MHWSDVLLCANHRTRGGDAHHTATSLAGWLVPPGDARAPRALRRLGAHADTKKAFAMSGVPSLAPALTPPGQPSLVGKDQVAASEALLGLAVAPAHCIRDLGAAGPQVQATQMRSCSGRQDAPTASTPHAAVPPRGYTTLRPSLPALWSLRSDARESRGKGATAAPTKPYTNARASTLSTRQHGTEHQPSLARSAGRAASGARARARAAAGDVSPLLGHALDCVGGRVGGVGHVWGRGCQGRVADRGGRLHLAQRRPTESDGSVPTFAAPRCALGTPQPPATPRQARPRTKDAV